MSKEQLLADDVNVLVLHDMRLLYRVVHLSAHDLILRKRVSVAISDCIRIVRIRRRALHTKAQRVRHILRSHVHSVVARPLISIQQCTLGDLRAGNPTGRYLLLGRPTFGASHLLSDSTIFDTVRVLCSFLATRHEPLLLDLTSTWFFVG